MYIVSNCCTAPAIGESDLCSACKEHADFCDFDAPISVGATCPMMDCSGTLTLDPLQPDNEIILCNTCDWEE